ncbi:subtilisin-like protein [Phlegmacium glaucopus]|nr:subtilisin-like protein [Phlegmacium glaucopus]
MLWSSLLVLGLVQLSTSKAFPKRWDNLTIKHSWAEIPHGWEHKAPAPSNYVFELRIGLKQNRIDDLIDNLMEISDPTNARYTQHLTKEEVQNFVAPHPDSVAVVNSWLQFHAIDSLESVHRSDSGDWVTLRIPVDLAEQMLGTTYNVYRHAISGQEVVRTLSYSLPEVLHEHIDVIAPTTYFGTFRSMKVTSFLQPELDTMLQDTIPGPDGKLDPSCNTIITPACLRVLYNTSSYVPVSTDVNKLAVAGYLDEFANYADLQTFFKKYRTDAVGSTFTTVQVNGGGNDQSNPGIEANLDIQYTTGISHPTPNIYYSTGGSPIFKPDKATPNNTNEPYLDFLNFILDQDSIAQVLSTSYGDDEQTVPPEYAVKVCNLFAQLGVRGTTVLFSSGDSGVGAGNCTTNDDTQRTLFQPEFPASCPYVTTVGATEHINPEVAVSFSGGGFSRLFLAPSYQTKAVSKYLKGLGSKYAGLYRATGRAYPDISAQGVGFQVIIGGKTSSVGGTSASCPTVAGIFALLNDYRLSQGGKPLGFINPLIYSYASSGFTDIVSGSNPGCGTDGFTAVEGWDPVTGLGTPNFVELKKILCSF